MTFDDWKWKLTFQDPLQMVLLPNRKPSLEVCSSGWIIGMLSAVDCISGKFGLVNYSQIHPDSCSCLLLSCFFHVESKIWGTFRQKEILIKWWFHCLVNQWNCCFTKRKSTTHFVFFSRVMYQNLTIEQLVNVLSIEWGDTRNCWWIFLGYSEKPGYDGRVWRKFVEKGQYVLYIYIYYIYPMFCGEVTIPHLLPLVVSSSTGIQPASWEDLEHSFGSWTWRPSNSLEISKLELFRFHFLEHVYINLLFLEPDISSKQKSHPWVSEGCWVTCDFTSRLARCEDFTNPPRGRRRNRPANAGGSASGNRAP